MIPVILQPGAYISIIQIPVMMLSTVMEPTLVAVEPVHTPVIPVHLIHAMKTLTNVYLPLKSALTELTTMVTVTLTVKIVTVQGRHVMMVLPVLKMISVPLEHVMELLIMSSVMTPTSVPMMSVPPE